MSAKKHKGCTGNAGLRERADALAGQIEAEEELLVAASRMPPSDAACLAAERVRCRREALLTERCGLLHKLSKSLESRNLILEKENCDLRESNGRLSYKLKRARLELQRALGIKGSRDSRDDEADTGRTPEVEPEPKDNRPRRRGAPKGHRGNTRPIPDRVDREEVFLPPETCDCGCGEILPGTEYDAKYIEDIPPVSIQVTRRVYLRGHCINCGKVIRHPEAVNGPPVEIGPNLAVQLALLNQSGMSFGKLSAFSTNTLGIPLTPSGALGLVRRVTDSLTGVYADIGEYLREQGVLNGDETGWKVLGRNCYIWCFCNEMLAYFHPDYRRSGKVIVEIVGEDFPGVVICDFYAAYNCIDKTQRCLVHLLRDIKKEREVLSSKLLERFDQAVRAFINDGLKIQAMSDCDAKEKAIGKLEKQLDKIIRMPVTKGRGETLIKRMQKYRNDLIRFVTHPGIEFHNNRAERQLRPMVITRKISFGSNTERGALRHCILNTVVETCKLQKVDPVVFLNRAYNSNGLDVPDLTANSPPAAVSA